MFVSSVPVSIKKKKAYILFFMFFLSSFITEKLLSMIKEIKLKHLGLNHNIGAKSVDFT